MSNDADNWANWARWTVEEATRFADAAGSSKDSLFVAWVNERKRADEWMKCHDELHDAVSALSDDCRSAVVRENVLGEQVVTVRWLRDHLRALLTTPAPDPYTWGDESVARSLAEGLGYADVSEVRS